MAKGESSSYSSAGKEVVSFSNKPFAEGDYPLTLLKEGLTVARSTDQGPDAIPYIKTRMRAAGTAEKEGQKDRVLFPMFFLSLKPGSDRVVMCERGGQLVELFRAHGEELNVPVLTQTIKAGTDNEEEVRYLDPEAVMEKLEEWVDTTVTGHVIIEKPRDQKDKNTGKVIKKADPNDPGQNKVQKFFAAEVEEEDEAPAQPASKKSLPSKKK